MLRIKCWSILILLAIACINALGINLVEDNIARVTIVIPETSAESVKWAAEELQRHVNKASGVTLPIISENQLPAKTPGMIFLGNCKQTKENGIDVSTLKRNEAIISVNNDNVSIAGKDDSGNWLGGTISTGTLFAVYDLLDKNLGVRWLWPGELGTFVPNKSTVEFAVSNSKFKLPLRFAHWRTGGAGNVVGWSDDANRSKFIHEQELWKTRNRMNLDLSLQYYPHGFTDYWSKLGKTNQEFFNLLPDGTRRPDTLYCGGRDDLISMCVSNPKLHRHIVEEWKNNFNPAIPQINVNENDTMGKCVCDSCMAWDESPIPAETRRAEAKKRFDAKDVNWAEALGNVSNRYAKFYLAVLAEADRLAPEKKAELAALCYANYSDAPKNKFNGRIIQRYCPPIMFPWTADKVAYYKNTWRGWADAGADMIMRPNFTLDGHCYPVDYHRQYADIFAFSRNKRLIGLDFDSLTGSFATQGLTLYTIARMQNDFSMSGADVEKEYYKAFAPAGNEIKAYFDYLADFSQNISVNVCNKVEGGNYSKFYSEGAKYFNDEFFIKANGLLKKAELKAEFNPESLARIKFLQTGLSNSELTVAAETAYLQYKKDGNALPFSLALKKLDDFRGAHEAEYFGNVGLMNSFEDSTWPRKMFSLMSDNMTPLPVEWQVIFDPDKIGEKSGYASKDFDHSKWSLIRIDDVWEKQPVGKEWEAKHGKGYNGDAWYRLSFEVPAEHADKRKILLFGAVDEACDIWMNGKKVLTRPYPFNGNTNSWQEAFEVDFSDAASADGKNVVAVKVINNSGDGGIWKGAFLKFEPKLLDNSKNIVLNGNFENALTNWDTHVGKGLVSASLDGKNVYSGKNSAKLSVEKLEKENPIGGKWQSWGRIIQKLSNLKVGQQYILQAMVRTSNDFDGVIGVWVRSNMQAPGLNAGNINLEWQKTGDKWQRLEGDFTPANKEGALYLNIMANSGSAYFDDVVILPAEKQSNLLSNGSFENKLTDWNYGSVMGDVAATVEKVPDKRGNVLKMQINSIDKDGKKVGTHGAWGRLHRELIGLVPGKKYKIQLQVKSKDLNGELGAWIRSDNTSDGLSKGNINLVSQDTAGKWVTLSDEFIPTTDKGMIYLITIGDKGYGCFKDIRVDLSE